MRVVATIVLLALPMLAVAITEPKSEVEYPDTIGLDTSGETVTLRATGVGLREKSFLKVDVYTIVSYVAQDADLGDDPGRTLRIIDAPKCIRMDLCRGFGRDKLIDSFREVIERNYDDTSAFADDMATFLGYFERDAQEGDTLLFKYVPRAGLTTELNGEVKGTIVNPAFATALWTVWFGDDPAGDDLRDNLLGAL